MHKFGLVMVLGAAMSAFAVEVPRPAGDVSIALPSGGAAKVSDYAGKVRVLAFILTT